ncbi:histidine kinase [Streptomyces sp. NPDC005799]|uniref:DUF7134 domain-containing protein n=1 Tax=Streptomyces sp. NPDC005799 TaxID=3154678 RepID=UPI0033F9811D
MTSPPTVERVGEPETLLGDSEHRMIVRLLSWFVRVNRADQAHPRVRHWGLPVLQVMFGIPALAKAVDGSGPGVPTVAALVIGLTVPLLWRERRPMPVFAVIAAVSVADIATGVMAGSNVSRLVALYNVARLGTPVQLTVTLAVSLPEAVVTGLVFSSYGPTSYFTKVPAMVTVLVVSTIAAVGLGLAGRVARAYIAALEDRAVRLETERDQRARLAVADERARVAREMHDILGHTLSVIVGLADGAAGLAETSPLADWTPLPHARGGPDLYLTAVTQGRAGPFPVRAVIPAITSATAPSDGPPHPHAAQNRGPTRRSPDGTCDSSRPANVQNRASSPSKTSATEGCPTPGPSHQSRSERFELTPTTSELKSRAADSASLHQSP